MARQKIQDRQQAIIEAAVTVFASRGFWDTPTSLISKTAGVADGTLFNYFQTKDDLINEVYLEIKRELAETMLDGIEAFSTFPEKMRHLWNQYIDWGVTHPQKFQVLIQIGASYELSDEVKAEGNEPFVELQQMAVQSIAGGEMWDYPVDYLTALMDNLAVATIRFIALNQDRRDDFKSMGLDIFLHGVML